MSVTVFRIPDDAISAAARAARRDPALDIGPWVVHPVPYPVASPTTGALLRVTGPDWSLFVKVVESFRHWPLLHVMPPELRSLVVDGPRWRYEADLYRSELAGLMPPGMRLPAVHGIVELGDDRLAVILEDVVTSSEPWPAERFARAGCLLGRLNARLTGAPGLPAVVLDGPAAVTWISYTSRVIPAALPIINDDAVWSHPLLAGATEQRLRADMIELATRIPAFLDVLGGLPQVLTHGDACPANLLVPADDLDTFVVIDWALGGMAAVGDELGQLLVGPVHDGAVHPDELPDLHDAVARAYTCGLTDEALTVAAADVRFGMDAGLVVRSAFTALPFDRLDEEIGDELVALMEHRLALTRYLVDVGLALPAEPARRRRAPAA